MIRSHWVMQKYFRENGFDKVRLALAFPSVFQANPLRLCSQVKRGGFEAMPRLPLSQAKHVTVLDTVLNRC